MLDRPTSGVRLLAGALVLIGAVSTLVPFWWMVSTSLETAAGVFAQPPHWFPAHPQWSNYVKVTTVVPFWRGLMNTLLLTVPPLVVGLLVSALAAYSFARLRFPGREALFGALLATLMIPSAVTMIPLFVLFRNLLGGQLPPANRPWHVRGGVFHFFLRQFFRSIPMELDEAARIDGCTPWQTFWWVILPLARAPLATLAVFGFLGGWNEFQGPLIYLSRAEQFPLQLVLADFQGLYYTDWALILAGATLASLPVILLYLVAQRYVTQGIATTGLK